MKRKKKGFQSSLSFRLFFIFFLYCRHFESSYSSGFWYFFVIRSSIKFLPVWMNFSFCLPHFSDLCLCFSCKYIPYNKSPRSLKKAEYWESLKIYTILIWQRSIFSILVGKVIMCFKIIYWFTVWKYRKVNFSTKSSSPTINLVY